MHNVKYVHTYIHTYIRSYVHTYIILALLVIVMCLFVFSHALAESDQSHITHEYDQIKEPKGSIPHQSSDSGEQYVVSLKAISNKTEKQQQPIPLVEYAEIDSSKNESPQHHNLPSGYEFSENITTANKEVSGHTYVTITTCVLH